MTPLRTASALTAAAFAFLALPLPASAAEPNPCGVADWFVNPDEANREPERTYAGFVFESADLIHHNAPVGLTTKTLQPGHYLASPAPDQPSFFSVEVSGDDGGYATLRYNRTTLVWDMVVAGTLYSDADPDKLVDLPPVHRSHKVVRFGVGYTANPPGTVTTTVKSLSFQGRAYYFSCPKPTQSPSATASPSTSPSPSASASASHGPSHSPSSTASTSASTSASASTTPIVPAGNGEASGGDNLPVTGTHRLQYLAGAALGVILAGLALVWSVRRYRRS